MNSLGSASLTVRQAAANTLSALQNAGIDTGEAYAEVKLILEHCLGLDLTQQLMHSEQIVTGDQQACIDAICKQRKARVPLQYCLGYGYFRGLKLAVSLGVLIPRSDTESLVQIAVEKAHRGARAVKLIADIGTGSGAIAVALAREISGVRVVAVDISPQAIEQAKENARTFNVEKQIDFLTGHWSCVLPNDLDMIVGNPPYLNNSHRESLPPEIIRYEPKTALFGSGADGLGFYRELAECAARHLKNEGEILLEIGDGQSEDVVQIFKAAGYWEQSDLHQDLNGLIRVASFRRA